MKLTSCTVVLLLLVAAVRAQTAPANQPAQQPQPQQPEFIRQGQQLMRDGKLEEALALYRQTLQTSPDSLPAMNAAGVVLDLMGKGVEARKYFARAIELAPPDRKAGAERAMAMSWAFEGDCKKTLEYQQKVLDYFVSAKDFFQQGEIADEGARVCLDAGDWKTALKWYQMGHDAGLQQPDIKPDRQDLWAFRWEHAQGRIAARRGMKEEAQKHVAAAKAILDKGTNPTQAPFLPYLAGYVALYTGDAKAALDELQKATQNDPFIQCLMAEAYEKLNEKDKAMELYRKAATTTAHNPAGAYARRVAKKKLA